MNEHATIINVTSDAESNEHTFYESPSPQPPCSPTKKRKANKGGPKSDEIWNYYNKGQEKNDGHYSATCYYCSKTWARGKPAKLKAHLANECLPCPPDINHFGSKKPLPLSVTERIDHALLKAWVIAGIPFEVIENPFVIDLFKELNPGYTPPSRTTLSGQLLDQEVARVNLNIEKELESSNNLTLSKEAALVAVKLWKNLNHSEQEKMDTPELWWGSIKNKPSHLSEIAIRLFGITPTQSNSELLYYDKTSTSNELRNVANDSSVGALMSLESENDYLNN
ncbi:4130_t:CDS:2, partial [Entrophospora sp. SA101]